jgi:hypothetical protein
MTVTPLAEGSLLEVVALRPADLPPAPWPTAPGAVRRGATGTPVILHHAHARWLVSCSDPEVRAWVDAVLAAGCVATDVSAKWRGFRLSAAARALASTLDVEATLSDRDCASVALFDCPAIVARSETDYLVWVPRSFSTAFLTALSTTTQ